ncbi:MAG TPA: hypothetical protein VER32_08100 [Pyrinomonadaceae bacterium]|nr:hypothetical protein [Pyrinomonadaceae bacterium]
MRAQINSGLKFFGRRPFAALFFALFLGATGASAQELVSEAPAAEALSRARAALVDSTEQHKASTAELLKLKEAEVAREAEKVEELRQLYLEGIVSRKQIEDSVASLADARGRLEALRQQIAESERLIAEIEAAEEAAEEMAKEQSAINARMRTAAARYRASGALIRYTGRTGFSPAYLGDVQAFFAASFGRPLPLSAVGQTATHNQMGYDHSHAVDVPVHPDSPEGRALISYLQGRGISFLAFRSAVPGASTGPHIHIGRPSGRL